MTVKEKLQKELSELNQKIIKLSEFLESDQEIAPRDKELLLLQRSTMNSYAWALKLRIAELEGNK